MPAFVPRIIVCVRARVRVRVRAWLLTQLLLKKSKGVESVEVTLERVKKAAGRVSTKAGKSK